MKPSFSVLGTLLLAACSTNKPAEDASSSHAEMAPASTTDDGIVVETTPDPKPHDATVEKTTNPTTNAAQDREDTPVVAPSAANADNTKKNQRDNEKSALTPVDQGNNETDLAITQKIRQAVMSDDSLSFTAKNVKIITVEGKVTLRGPVGSAQERAAIDAAAKRVAGAGNVDNQLEIKK